ncbi:MAG: hypothetical protein GY719_20375 [bacterium]|nr:hypothetical protein [bacterium]
MRTLTAAVAGILLAQAVPLSPLAAQEVTLPLARYDELRALAEPEPEPEPEPPALVAFEEAALTISVGETSARITQNLTVALYGDDWHRAALGKAGTFIDADLGGAEGRLNGGSIEIRGAGRHRIRLDSVVPVELDETTTRPTWRLKLGLPAAAMVHGVIEAPPGVEDVEAEGAIVTEANGRWSFVARPGGEIALSLRGTAAIPERAGLPLRFEASSASLLEVARSRRRCRAWLEIRVAQGSLERVEAAVPEGYEVLAVDGAIAGWDVEDDRLIVTPLAAVTDSLDLDIQLVAAEATEFASPLLLPEGAATTRAATRVLLSGDGLLDLVDTGDGRQPDSRRRAELPAPLRSGEGLTLVLPAGGSPPRWQVSWSESTEVLAAQIDRLLIDAVVGEAGETAYQLWAEVRNRGAARLTFELPAAAEMIAGSRDGHRLVPGRDGNAWTVPLAVHGERQVIYLASVVPLDMPSEEGRFELPLPGLSAPASRLEVRVALPGERRYELTERGRRGVVGEPPATPNAGKAGRLAKALGGAANGSAGAAAELFPRPPGFSLIEASWSALSTNPTALEIRVSKDSDKRGWF